MCALGHYLTSGRDFATTALHQQADILSRAIDFI
jgi:hypothetical protein